MLLLIRTEGDRRTCRGQGPLRAGTAVPTLPRHAGSCFSRRLLVLLLALPLLAGLQAAACDCTVVAEVVAIDQPWAANRLGTVNPDGQIFALRGDVVPIDNPADDFGNDIIGPESSNLVAGQVRLRSGKRPRPLVLRVNQGDCLEIQFQNLLASDRASVQATGMELLEGIGSQGAFVGANLDASTVPAPGEATVYRYRAPQQGVYLFFSALVQVDPASQGSGLFGLINVEPPQAEYYRSQVTRQQLEAATYQAGKLPAHVGLEREQAGGDAKQRGRFHFTDGQGEQQAVPVRIGMQGRLYLESGHPLINYQAEDADGRPILRMTMPDAGDPSRMFLVHGDLTAIITGPNGGRWPFSIQDPSFQANPASPDRRQPFRELSLVYHETFSLLQSFPAFSFPDLKSAFATAVDAFGINYGFAGIGAEIMANRFGVGPEGTHGDEVDLKFEEFFLSSWAVGDPAMVVDVPANAQNQVLRPPSGGQQPVQTLIFRTAADSAALAGLNTGTLPSALLQAFLDHGYPLTSPQVVVLTPSDDGSGTMGSWVVTDPNPPGQPVPAGRMRYPIAQSQADGADVLLVYQGMPDSSVGTQVGVFNPLAQTRATKAFYPDDPSNVYHSYLRDHVKFRVANATAAPHIHHQHAHQWLHTPNSDESHYLDSQLITNGSTYTLEMVYNGSGNRNQTVGDSIFHCHFYPHFAQGMWGLWRIHDVFESGTQLNEDGSVKTLDEDGNPLWNRALPDGEIASGTPIPAVVPLPTLGMAPLPAPVRVANADDPTIDGLDLAGRRAIVQPVLDEDGQPVIENGEPLYDNPGYPFFIPGIAGHRAVHPPLDLAPAENEDGSPRLDENGQPLYLDGGLPRHQVLDGKVVHNLFTRWDFSKDFILFRTEEVRNQSAGNYLDGWLSAYQLPESGTAVERAAMRFHAQRTHAGVQPNGMPGNFITNGLPPAPGAPYADPAVDDQGNAAVNLKRYKAANLQMDVVFNKKGWHYPQQRFLALWYDIKPTVSGERPPEPLFFRGHSGDTIEFWHTNLVPNYFDMDDFQVRTPTDILGQHIHLVKFDVIASDGAGDGFNYEDGTFSPDEVRERIIALNKNGKGENGGIYAFDPLTQFAAGQTSNLEIKPYKDYYPFFGDPPAYQNWDGAQTTIQRWQTDPLLNNLGEDRTLRTVFTHDHFSPSTHQQTGLYAGLLVEPERSQWFTNAPSWSASSQAPYAVEQLPENTAMHTRPDGGPTSWQAIINLPQLAESYREFMLAFQESALAYTAKSTFRKRRPDELDTPAPLFILAIPDGAQLQAGPAPLWLRDAFFLEGIALAGEAAVVQGSTTSCGSCGQVDGTLWTVTDSVAATPEGDCVIDLYTINARNQVFAPCIPPGWADPGFAIYPPPFSLNLASATQAGAPAPTLITDFPSNGTFTVNYRNEPIPSRVNSNIDPALAASQDPQAADLAFAYNSLPRVDPELNRQPLGELINPDDAGQVSDDPTQPQPFRFPKNPLNFNVSTFDPYTPLANAYQGDPIQVRTLVGAHLFEHSFQMHGVKWFFEPSFTDSGYRSVQGMGISEHFEMRFRLPHSQGGTYDFADYLVQPASESNGQTNGVWQILRGYAQSPLLSPPPEVNEPAGLVKLPSNPDPGLDGQPLRDRYREVGDIFAACPPIFKNGPASQDKACFLPKGFISYHVIATTAAQVLEQVSEGRLVVNSRGKVETNSSLGGQAFVPQAGTELVNPFGLIYVLAGDLEQLDGEDVLKGHLQVEPLILRANAGDWIQVRLENRFAPGALFAIPSEPSIVSALDAATVSSQLAADFAAQGVDLEAGATVVICGCAWRVTSLDGDRFTILRKAGQLQVYDAEQALAYTGSAAAPFGLRPTTRTDAGTPSTDCSQPFTVDPVCLTTTANVGLNPQLLAMDVAGSNGFNLGFNPDQTALPGGTTVTYLWYAGNLDVTGGKLVETPVELGAVNLRASEPLVAHQNGLFAALIVEPPGTLWLTDAGTRASATIFDEVTVRSPFKSGQAKRGAPLYREFVAIFLEDQNSWMSGSDAVTTAVTQDFSLNYKSEPNSYRDSQGTADFAWQSNTIVLSDPGNIYSGDPQTPVFHASGGIPTRLRLLYAGGNLQQIFMADGHSWQEEPYVDDSRAIGVNPLSQTFGSQQIAVNQPLNLVFPSAGGSARVPGDYLLTSYNFASCGNWGLLRVSDELLRVTTARYMDGSLLMGGYVLQGPSPGGGVGVTLHRHGSDGATEELGTVTTRGDGAWAYRGRLVLADDDQVCATLAGGDCARTDGRAVRLQPERAIADRARKNGQEPSLERGR